MGAWSCWGRGRVHYFGRGPEARAGGPELGEEASVGPAQRKGMGQALACAGRSHFLTRVWP